MAGKRIDEHTLRVLEFEDVKTILASFAASDLGRDAAKGLYPSVDQHWVQARIAETTELSSVLEPAELLEISDTLAASGRLRLFLTNLERSVNGGAKFGVPRLRGADPSFPPKGGTPNVPFGSELD